MVPSRRSQAFIPVSQETPALDPSYLADRATTYAAALRPALGSRASTSLPLTLTEPAAEPAAAVVEAVVARLLARPPADPQERDLARETATAAAGALSGMAIRAKHDVLLTVG